MAGAISMQTNTGARGTLVIRLSLDIGPVLPGWSRLTGGGLNFGRRWDHLPPHLLRDIGKSELEAEVERLLRSGGQSARVGRMFSWDRLPPGA